MTILSKIKNSTWIKINCILTIFIAVFLLINYFNRVEKLVTDTPPQEINVCCSFPCENGGICISEDKGYTCDCRDTGYFGKNCQKITPMQWLRNLFKSNPTQACSALFNIFPSFWKLINSFSLLQHIFAKNLYLTTINWGGANYRWTATFDHILSDSFINVSFSRRSLPPIPKVCLTPMGVRGPKELPSTDVLYERLLKRREFQACSKGTNLLFVTYMQHFESQFNIYETKESKQHQWENTIDMSHIYGKDEITKEALRSFDSGKLKSRIYEGEEYPPYFNDCPEIKISHPKMVFQKMLSHKFHPQWALGNPSLSMTPMLFTLSTIWLREHNRICKILANEHKHWNDEELYQTAKHIVTGEVIKITLTEFMQHFIQTRMEILHKPEILSDFKLQFNANVPQEFSILPQWYCFLPEKLLVESKPYNLTKLLFTNNNIVFKYGLDTIINAMTTESAGEITKNNIANIFKHPIENTIKESRLLRVQSFNNYRRRFGLKPVQSFEELTGDLHIASILKELYIDIEAVELVIGLLVENRGKGVVPPTMTVITEAWLVHGLLSHPINSREWWKSSTFGGEVGMNIIKTATLKKLICFNIKSQCRDVYVSFSIPYQ